MSQLFSRDDFEIVTFTTSLNYHILISIF